MVSYNRETGLFEHTVYSTTNMRESRIIRERLREAKIPFRVCKLPLIKDEWLYAFITAGTPARAGLRNP